MKNIYYMILLFIFCSCGAVGEKRIDNAHSEKFIEKVRWSDNSFPVIVKFNSADFSSLEYVNAANEAINTWNNAAGFEILRAQFVDMEFTKNYTSIEQYLQDGDLMSSVPVMWPHSNESGEAIAVTSFSYNSNGFLLHADILFNDYYTFETNGSFCCIDLETVLLHELGHFLGLKHIREEDDSTSVMNPSVTNGEVNQSLSATDVFILKRLYNLE